MHSVVLGADGMTIEEAIKLLEIQKPVLGCKEYKKPLMCAYEMAIAALEKQMPYKPKEYCDKYYSCKCGNVVMMKYKKYPTELMPKKFGLDFCLCCGQKIDWSEVKE